jgi:hypothetical protein
MARWPDVAAPVQICINTFSRCCFGAKILENFFLTFPPPGVEVLKLFLSSSFRLIEVENFGLNNQFGSVETLSTFKPLRTVWNRQNHIHHTGLYHPLDGVTNPKYKLLRFLTTIIFYKEKKALAFNWDRCCYLVLCLWLITGNSYWRGRRSTVDLIVLTSLYQLRTQVLPVLQTFKSFSMTMRQKYS